MANDSIPHYTAPPHQFPDAPPAMTPLERAARALYERFPEGQLIQDAEGRQAITGIPWENVGAQSKQRWLDDARAVIVAISEPSEAMRQAGRLSTDRDGWDGPSACWELMIDALLEQGPPTS